MKALIRVVKFIWILMLLFVVSCSSQGGSETAVTTEPAAVANEPATAEATDRPVDPNRLYAVPDLSQVASTGRPQFLNSFANW
jgi:hypothetical protein